jgi:hypothetical protein
MVRRFHVLGGMPPHDIFLRFPLAPGQAARYYGGKLQNDERNKEKHLPLTRAALSTCAEQKAKLLSL